QLIARARGLAEALLARGVTPERTVALAAERDTSLAVGLLGILAAGGAWVPLDVDLPVGRRRRLLERSGASWVVTTAALAPRLMAEEGLPAGVECILLEDLPQEGAETASGFEGLPWVEDDSLAYVVFTSGSTGEPKGAAISHRSLTNFALAARDAFSLRPSDRILQFSPLVFNVVLEELFPTWLAGGAVVLEAGVEKLGVPELEELIERRAITGLELPSGYWHEWARQLQVSGGSPPASLRVVILGCDKPVPDRVEAWRRHEVSLVVVFGLTETAITSTVHPWNPDDPEVRLPIGKPVANTRVYVLDDRGEPIPEGLVGRLFIGGDGVGRGYWGDSRRTAERFLPDPFSERPGERV
ncbi:MAG: AMP-binding protein, partial [Acidobacteria bacterium]|nr:AMP-binding protein [Acidobacteriota bacterium]